MRNGFLVVLLAGLAVLATAQHNSLPLLNVHIVPHTHDDVGWLKTVDQYYVGSRNNIQWASVRYILDTTIRALREDSSRRFIYVEVAFFERWWVEQTESMKESVRNLVRNGQLEFVNGGWCMNDEATTYYQSVIDQMTLGHRWLNDTFGIRPNIGWSIDPFGHSSQFASALSDMGMDAFVVGRIDDADRERRRKEQTMEFVWRSSSSLGRESELLGAVTYEGYNPFPGFNFDSSGVDTPIQDRPDLEGFNVYERCEEFARIAREWAAPYGGRDLMVTAGSDFQYSNAHMWFINNDKIIQFFKEHPEYNLNVFYSTPTHYFNNRQKYGLQHPFTVKTDDFFPYSTGHGHAYWTGYFTSRPALKLYDRTSNAHLQVCKQLSVLADVDGDVETLRRAMGVLQHHDAVSGTEKQHVANNYALRVFKGNSRCDGVIENALQNLAGTEPSVQFQRCRLLNESICAATQRLNGDSVQVVVYNGMAQSRTEMLRLPVEFTSWTVTDSAGTVVESDVFENIPDAATKAESAPYSLYFEVTVPAVGFSTYTISAHPENTQSYHTFRELAMDIDLVIDNQLIQARFQRGSGRLFSVQNKLDEVSVQVNQTWMQYYSHDGSDGFSPSGAYIFRPTSRQPTFLANGGDVQSVKIARGGLVTIVHQTFSNAVSQQVLLYRNSTFLDIEYTVGPIDISNGIGREIITRFSTNIDNNDTFYTDSNGREMLERRRDYRPSWNLKQTENVAENYYPVTTSIYLRNQNAQMTVLTDRSQGGGSTNNMDLEIMVHRRLLHDDYLGVDESLNEPGEDGRGLIIRGTHRLLVDSIDRASAHQRFWMERLAHPLAPKFVSGASLLPKKQYSALQQDLPPNLHLVTLDRIDNRRVLLRIGHLFAAGEDQDLSVPVSLSLSSLFRSLCIVKATETSLTSNQRKSDIVRRYWNDGVFSEPEFQQNRPSNDGTFDVSIAPMQIKTWIVEIDRSVHVCPDFNVDTQ